MSPNTRTTPAHAPASTPGRQFAGICTALVCATLAVYWRVKSHGFVDYDDPDYVSAAHVASGFTRAGVAWAFTSGEASNWFPLTRLSHMLDVELFGMQSGWHHATNVLLHALATLLLFAFLERATGARWRSAVVALLFAVHPLHVESVAWVAERKDVLSACFWFLTLWAYVRHAERPGAGRYALVVMCFCLGAMSKPMVVTLPFVLLLLDFWPLRRVRSRGRPESADATTIAPIAWKFAVWEKLPLMLLSAGTASIAYLAQRSGGSVELLEVRPLGARVANALISYVAYIADLFWPARLAVLYPYSSHIAAWQIALAAAVLIGISILALRARRSCPYFVCGWLWYLGTLVPVIGVVQVGVQARADRYTYLPMVGLFVSLAWGAADIARRWPRARVAVRSATVVACAVLAVASRRQTEYWTNTETLCRRAIEVTEDNYVMHDTLGFALARDRDRLPEAVEEYRRALRISPDFVLAHKHLAEALGRLPGSERDAIAEWDAALRLQPADAGAQNNLGIALAKIPERLADAISAFEAALRIQPDFAQARMNLGLALARVPGRLPDAISAYEAVLRIAPDDAGAHYNLGLALEQIPGRSNDAVAEYQRALLSRPDNASMHNTLGTALARLPGRLPEAIEEFRAALRIDPGHANAHRNLGLALTKTPGHSAEAIAELEAALRLAPDPAVRQLLERLRSGGQAGR